MSDSSWAPFGPSGDDEEPPRQPAPVEEPEPDPEPVAFEPPIAPPPPAAALDRPAPAPAPPPVTRWPGPPPQAYGTPTRIAGNATASLVLGIVGLVICPLVASVPAIVLGRRARREIAEHPNELGGDSQARWGIGLGWVGVAFGVLALLLFALGATQL